VGVGGRGGRVYGSGLFPVCFVSSRAQLGAACSFIALTLTPGCAFGQRLLPARAAYQGRSLTSLVRAESLMHLHVGVCMSQCI
jgi:hypothetical protein